MKRNSGAITVGPDTTRMAPVISAAPVDIPSSSAANAQVIGTPQVISWITTRRVPAKLAKLQSEPGVVKVTATARDISCWNAAPSSSSGLTSLVNAPAMKPAGSKMFKCRDLQAARQHLRTDASTGIRPPPNKT
jgi:hypothetical protein